MQSARIRTHNEQTTNGKAFVLFLSLIVRTYLMRKLNQYLTDKSTSLKKVLNQLTNITVITTDKKARLIKALTKEQKTILSAFDAKDNILQSLKTCLR